jgi:aarF domain-containing kinase
MQRARRLAAATAALALAGYAADRTAGHGAVARNVRAVAAAAATVWDYKVRLAGDARDDALERVHARVAHRWYELCRRNGGLYIKLGQQIATLSHVLPGEYLAEFAQLQDRAPACAPAAVRRVVEAELGARVEDVFASFEWAPAASASIAQVHRATLPDGTAVAVKVQKPNIAPQMPVDLLCYRLLVWCFDRVFDLPLHWMTANVCETLRHEVDFVHEAANLEASRADFAAGAFAGRVHVPAVHWAQSARRVLTMEWIDGVKLTDTAALAALAAPVAVVMRTLVSALAYQVFVCGRVHGDPHPGNIMVRRHPDRPGDHQVVLLDHGLYITESEAFRRSYCGLWQAMVLGDTPALRAICTDWGIGDPELFASLQLFRRYEGAGRGAAAAVPPGIKIERSAAEKEALREQAKERLRRLLSSTEHIPRELIIIGRHFNIVRANNKELGSPVNRINLTAEQAARGAAAVTAGSQHDGWRGAWRVLVFRFRQWTIEAVFRASQVWAAAQRLAGRSARTFEQLLEDNFARALEANLGLQAASG